MHSTIHPPQETRLKPLNEARRDETPPNPLQVAAVSSTAAPHDRIEYARAFVFTTIAFKVASFRRGEANFGRRFVAAVVAASAVPGDAARRAV